MTVVRRDQVLTQSYKRLLQVEVKKKANGCYSNMVDSAGLICFSCGKRIKVGSNVHVQRGSCRVKIFHRRCWNLIFI